MKLPDLVFLADLISHDMTEWGAFGAAAIGIIALFAIFAGAIAMRVNLKRDIEIVRDQLDKHEKRDDQIFEKLDSIQTNQNTVGERLARIEQTLSITAGQT